MTVGETFLGGIGYELDVAGRDISGELTYSDRRILMVVVGDRAWAKHGDAEWAPGARDDETIDEILDVFRYVGDPHALVYIGSRSAGGEAVEAFRNDGPIPYQTAAMKDLGLTGMTPTLQLWLFPDGTPRVIRVRTKADARDANGVVQHITTNSIIEITNWGEPIEIKPPV